MERRPRSDAWFFKKTCADLRPSSRSREKNSHSALSLEEAPSSVSISLAIRWIRMPAEPYWDGGYSGNPTITPLIRECKSQDTILVQINPVERERSPRSASEILNRLIEGRSSANSRYKSLEERDKEIASSAEFRKCLYDYDVEKAAMSYLSKV